MNQTLTSCLVVLALILIEALFVASEIALVSLREARCRSSPSPAAAARSSPAWSATRTASWPPCRSA